MRRIIFTSIFSLSFLCLGAQSFWRKSDPTSIQMRSGEERTIVPDEYETFKLDLNGLRNYLYNAPEESFKKEKSGIALDMPMADGRIESFYVYESSVMMPGLAAKFPDIKSYIAVHKTKKSTHMRFAVSPYGFHGSIRSLAGDVSIDPYATKNTEDYIVYNDAAYNPDLYKNIPMCGSDHQRPSGEQGFFNPIKSRTAEVQLKVFKVAMACTGEWGTKRGTVAKCLADINTMMTRMNLIYEKEMAIRFLLIDDNDKLIFLDPATDPYNNSDQGKVILGTNTGVINPRITGGAASYDIGHVLSICFDIGGVAQGGSACQTNKGNGVTCNNDNDLSGIVKRVMSHEVAHQLDASHTWNICQPNDPNTANQRAGETAYEPGSGTTIMSYAGACSVDNVLNDNDEYFHVASIEQMTSKTTAPGNATACSDKVNTGNHYPEITMPTKIYTIPRTTPFVLQATATDEDGDDLTYTWEQYDKGEAVALGTNSISGPLFRSFKPAANGWTRFVPEPSSLLTGKLTAKNEVLPENSRDLNFKMTVRDNAAGGAGLVWDDYKVKVVSTAGPFKMIFPLVDNNFTFGQRINVTWEVANTNVAPVNCQKVNIYGSFAGALRDEDPNLVPLALGVPNDGAQEVYIPNRASNLFRIVVKAADNIFLTCSTIPSKVAEPSAPTLYFESPSFVQVCQPSTGQADIKAVGYGGLTGNVDFSILQGLPAGATATFDKSSLAIGESTKLTINASNVIGSLTQDIVVRAISAGIDTIDRIITVEIVGGNINNINTLNPANGSETDALPKFNWNKKADAVQYRIEVATNPAFTTLLSNSTLADSNFIVQSVLESGKVYYWRVTGINKCGEGTKGEIKAFITKAFNCSAATSGPVNLVITGAGTPTIEQTINVATEGTVSDINVKSVKAEHSRSGDLVVSLISPSGKSVLLWSKRCGTSQNVNVSIDDQSPAFFQCPINTGKIYRPEGKLSDFNGENIKGDWKLKIEDQASGSGGKLTEVNLEICGSVSVKAPYIIKNNVLNIAPTDRKNITSDLLVVGDDDTDVANLTYTLVDKPSKGNLLFNGQIIEAGATFTQVDLNSNRIEYKSTSSDNTTDVFRFVVTDGTGGWLSITNFNIDINQSHPSGTADELLQAGVHIYPNPSTDVVTVNLEDNVSDFVQFQLLDIAGRVVTVGQIQGQVSTISLDGIQKGMYTLTLSNGKNRIAKKLIKL